MKNYYVILVVILTLLPTQTLKSQSDNYSCKEYYDIGLREMESDNYPIAITDFTKALEIDSSRSEIYFDRGRAYVKTSEFEKAISDFDVFISKNEKFAEAYYYRGLAKLELDQKEDGCKDFKKAYSLGFFEAGEYISQYCE